MNTFKKLQKDIIIGLIALAIFLVVLFVTKAGFIMNFVTFICLFLIAGQGWNLLGGYIGEISFGHAIFFGIGSYTVGLPIGYKLGLPIWLTVILAPIVAAAFAYVISYPLLRIKGFPFLIGTYGLGIVFEKVFISTPALFATRGIFVPPVNKYLLYILIAVITIVIIVLTEWLVNQDIGLSFKAVRDAEIAASMVGINSFVVKRRALVIGAAYGGIAGALYALYSSFVHPITSFSVDTSLAILLGAYIGGAGTVLGPVIGGALVIIIQELSRAYVPISGGHHLIIGLVLVLVMLLAREGIYPTILKAIEKKRVSKTVER